MFKFLVKVVVVVLALQAALGYLKKEGLISGEIHINYSAVKAKLLELVPEEKIANEVKGLIFKKVIDELDSKIPGTVSEFSQQISNEKQDYEERKLLIHVISPGETLKELSRKYGVSDKVIKKINKINGDGDLVEGKEILIPFIPKNVT